MANQNHGFAPGTIANPPPYGVRRYSHVMDNYAVAAVVPYMRAS